AEAAGTSTATFTAHITVVAAPGSSTPPPTHSPGSSTPPPTHSPGSSTPPPTHSPASSTPPPTHSPGSSTPPTNSPNTSTASHNPSHNPEGGGSEVSQTGSDIRAAVLTGSLILLCGAFLVALGLIRRRAKQH